MIPLELQRLFARLQLLDARTVSTEVGYAIRGVGCGCSELGGFGLALLDLGWVGLGLLGRGVSFYHTVFF